MLKKYVAKKKRPLPDTTPTSSHSKLSSWLFFSLSPVALPSTFFHCSFNKNPPWMGLQIYANHRMIYVTGYQQQLCVFIFDYVSVTVVSVTLLSLSQMSCVDHVVTYCSNKNRNQKITSELLKLCTLGCGFLSLFVIHF